jgi:sodium-dependent dicarboxylate transporter 2/3/5
MKIHLKKLNFAIGPILFLIVSYLPIAGLSDQGQSVLACTVWVAFWWITEAVELPVASILPMLIFPLSGALTIEQTTSSYGNPYIYLFMGGFILGLSIEKWNLHKRIAYNIINKVGTSEKNVLLGFMIATAFLSMWISNTATAIMMLPIGVSVASHFENSKIFSKNLMLGIAYAASIGGLATLIGTPPNIIFAGVVKESLGVEISFFDWMLFATPLSAVLLIGTWWYLSRYKISADAKKGSYQPLKLEKISIQEKRVAAIFIITAFLWITRSFIWNKMIPGMDDTVIAILGALLMFTIPAGEGKGTLMDWKTARKLPWDVLLIFGAGLAIAKGFSQTDLTTWLATHFSDLSFLPVALVVIIIIASINFLTEITSNTATASMVLPLLITLSASLAIETMPLLAGAAIASSCAFMLPVATPPNAIVFSSGHVSIKDMMRAGFALNIFSIFLIYLFIQLVWPIVFG